MRDPSTPRPPTRWRRVLDLAVPESCALCRAAGLTEGGVCRSCRAELAAAAAAGPLRWQPTPAPVGFPPTLTATAGSEGLLRLLSAWKDAGRGDLDPLLAHLLGGALRASWEHPEVVAARWREEPVLIVPVPSSRAAIRRRGRHPLAEVVERAVDRSLSSARVVEVLRLAGRVRDQAGLDAGARAANLARAVLVRPSHVGLVAGHPVLLVDDLVTTGASLTAAADALRRAGADVVLGVTMGATARKVAAGPGAD
jgi:predicted amidophosphoribosyltransferase